MPVHNLIKLRSAHADFTGESRLGHAACFESVQCAFDKLITEPAPTACFAAHPFYCPPALLKHLNDVFFLRANPQMVGVAAFPVVAGVKDVQPWRYGTVGRFIREAMCRYLPGLHFEGTVTVPVAPAQPGPTSVPVIRYAYTGPESRDPALPVNGIIGYNEISHGFAPTKRLMVRAGIALARVLGPFRIPKVQWEAK
jgi:hypothetical protein